MNFIRSLLFSLFFIVVTIVLGVLIPINLLKKNRKDSFDKFGTFWSGKVLWGLKHITKIDWEIEGAENVINTMNSGRNCVIAGKHQSTWETLIMHHLFYPYPSFILKKELLRIPIFGTALGYSSCIAIDRKGTSEALKISMDRARDVAKSGHPVVIFPQGTRVPVGKTVEEYPYKAGVIGIVKEIHADIVPMVLNSGMLWGKKQFLKKPGKITMKFLKPIKYEEIEKYQKRELLKKLEEIIENGTNELLKINENKG